MNELQYTIVAAESSRYETPLLALPHFEGESKPRGEAREIDQLTNGQLTTILERGDFKGKGDEALIVYPSSPEVAAERIVLIGLGRQEEYSIEKLRRAVGTAVRQGERIGATSVAFGLGFQEGLPAELTGAPTAQAITEAATLAGWEPGAFKTKKGANGRKLIGLTILISEDDDEEAIESGAHYGATVARAENFARTLQSAPGNTCTPIFLAEEAGKIAEEYGLGLTVFDRDALEREGMSALLAVARGSEEDPRMIILEYRGEGAPEGGPLVLVGKGVTFDSGGISIKPSAGMEDMKYDMSGAAAVLAATMAVAELELPVHLITIVPSTENLPSGKSLKPGDIIGSHLGKTIEVINTDAEGRLILADALSYAQRYEPSAIVDAATLTGACVIALGHHATGLMGTDQALVDQLFAAGETTGERCWQLPLWDEFRPQLDSDFADLKNVGGRPAGTITAGLFLKEFVGDFPWAHLDIAGTAYRDSPVPYMRKGATGTPTRLFVEWVRTRSTH